MSNLKLLITFACFLVGSTFLFGQPTLSVSPTTGGVYLPNSTQTFTFVLDGVTEANCQGVWVISAESSSNYADYTSQMLNEHLDLMGSLQGGIVELTFNTPPSGDLTISNITATPPGSVGCTYSPISISPVVLSAIVIGSPLCSDGAFLEDFESVAAGTGFPASPGPSTPIGQGTAYLQMATFSSNSYFHIVSENIPMVADDNEKLEVRASGSEVYWESNNIPISPCCSRDFSVDVYGNGNSTDDYVEVWYRIDGGSPVFLERNEGNFGKKTVQFSNCNLPMILAPANLQIQIRIQNNGNNERHGFDNLKVTEGNIMDAPQVLNITCSGDAMNATVTFTTATECTAGYNIDGNGFAEDNPVILSSGNMHVFSVRDTKFPDCGTTSGTIFINAEGNCDFVLPISLLDFYGRAEADAIALYWTTSTELNNDYMAVERSQNGIDFEEIGQVEGKGTTTEPQQYTFVDNHPISGTNYYRLRQVDYDGAVAYHPVISVLFDKPLAFGMKISPNPARETLQVDWSLPKTQDGLLRVFDMQGQLLSQRAIAHGSGRYNLPIRNLPAGIYVLQLEQGGQTKTLRFVKE